MVDVVEGSLLKFKVEVTFTLYGYPQKDKDTSNVIRIINNRFIQLSLRKRNQKEEKKL